MENFKPADLEYIQGLADKRKQGVLIHSCKWYLDLAERIQSTLSANYRPIETLDNFYLKSKADKKTISELTQRNSELEAQVLEAQAQAARFKVDADILAALVSDENRTAHFPAHPHWHHAASSEIARMPECGLLCGDISEILKKHDPLGHLKLSEAVHSIRFQRRLLDGLRFEIVELVKQRNQLRDKLKEMEKENIEKEEHF